MVEKMKTYTAMELKAIAIENGLELELKANGSPKASKGAVIEQMLAFGIEVEAKVEEEVKESKEDKVVFSRPMPMSKARKTRRS